MRTLTTLMITFATAFASNALASQPAQPVAGERPPLSAEAINTASLAGLAAGAAAAGPAAAAESPDPAIVRLQILLDRAGASPGVIDGFAGDNVDKAVLAFEIMHNLPPDGRLDEAVIAALGSPGPVIGHYVVTPADAAAIVPPIPDDYGAMAARDHLGYQSLPEAIAERFHMDVDLLAALNPGVAPRPGSPMLVAAFGPDRSGKVVRIEADKTLRQVRAYDAAGSLLAAYPATIGSAATPSPTGVHTVEGVATMPTYAYNPELNFQQGDNAAPLTLPPGPNGPVGTIWIDLSEPTYGIHGTPEPSLIDKVGSHGCIRLTNWDAEELAAMVEPGVVVAFID